MFGGYGFQDRKRSQEVTGCGLDKAVKSNPVDEMKIPFCGRSDRPPPVITGPFPIIPDLTTATRYSGRGLKPGSQEFSSPAPKPCLAWCSNDELGGM